MENLEHLQPFLEVVNNRVLFEDIGDVCSMKLMG